MNGLDKIHALHEIYATGEDVIVMFRADETDEENIYHVLITWADGSISDDTAVWDPDNETWAIHDWFDMAPELVVA